MNDEDAEIKAMEKQARKAKRFFKANHMCFTDPECCNSCESFIGGMYAEDANYCKQAEPGEDCRLQCIYEFQICDSYKRKTPATGKNRGVI